MNVENMQITSGRGVGVMADTVADVSISGLTVHHTGQQGEIEVGMCLVFVFDDDGDNDDDVDDVVDVDDDALSLKNYVKRLLFIECL